MTYQERVPRIPSQVLIPKRRSTWFMSWDLKKKSNIPSSVPTQKTQPLGYRSRTYCKICRDRGPGFSSKKREEKQKRKRKRKKEEQNTHCE